MKPFAGRSKHWHWPYSKAEAAAIRDYFDPPSQRALEIVVNAASNFIDLYDPDRKKQNIREQIARLGTAVHELQRALSGISGAAEDHLRRNRRVSKANEPVETDALHRLLHQFAYENRSAFLNLPEMTKAGPKEKLLEKSLTAHFEKAFIAGHGGVRPRNGFPEFERHCRATLERVNGGLLESLDGKSLQKKRRTQAALIGRK